MKVVFHQVASKGIETGRKMRVRAIYNGILSEIVGCDSETIESDLLTLGTLIDGLEKRHGDRIKELKIRSASEEDVPWLLILVNGQRVDLSTKLEDGDEVDFVMPLAGG